MSRSKRFSRLSVLALALAAPLWIALACDGDGEGTTQPQMPQDPTGQYAQQAQAVIDVSTQYFGENDAIVSLDALSLSIASVGFNIAPLQIVTRALAAGWSPGGDGFVPLLEAASWSGIPANLKGTVWTLQEGSIQYTQDSGQTGPADGVRFILYDINLATGTPETPLVPIGHVDITEAGGDPTDVDFDVVIGGTQQLGLSIDATIGTALQVTGTGSISNGGEPMNVNFFVIGTVNQGVFDVGATVSLTNSLVDIDADMQATGTIQAPQLTTTTTVFITGTRFTIQFFSEYDGATNTIDGSAFVAGDLVGHLSDGPGGTTVLVPAGAENLSQDDLGGLALMFDAIDQAFDDSLGIIGLFFAVLGFSLL